MGQPSDLPNLIPDEETPRSGGGIVGILTSKLVMIVLGLLIGAAGMYFGGPQLGIFTIDGGPPPTVAPQGPRINPELTAYQNTGYTSDQVVELGGNYASIVQMVGEIEAIQVKLEDMTDLEAEYHDLQERLQQLQTSYEDAQATIATLETQRILLSERKAGLEADIGRLKLDVGDLRDADRIRIGLSTAFEAAVGTLAVRIHESSPLVPPSYRKNARLETITRLRDQVEGSSWVTPDMLEDFVQLVDQEIARAEDSSYFIAKLPLQVKDQVTYLWSECLTQGADEVIYRTANGKHIGVFRKGKDDTGITRFLFDGVPVSRTKKDIVRLLDEFRPDGAEERLQEEVAKDAGQG